MMLNRERAVVKTAFSLSGKKKKFQWLENLWRFIELEKSNQIPKYPRKI